MAVPSLAVASRRSAYVALVFLTLVWGNNWLVMKQALTYTDPVTYNIQRTAVAVAFLFVLLIAQRRPLLPDSWLAVVVTGLFQTTLNMGATTMALAEGGAGRTSVLVFTMPFWTVLIAWPVLGERLRGLQWLAVAAALAGLTLIVEPWNWQGAIAPKLWAVASGLGWAAGTIAVKFFQRQRQFDLLNFMAWQMLVGLLPLLPVAALAPTRPPDVDLAYTLLLLYTGAVSTGGGFVVWIAILRWLDAGTASLNALAIPVIALVSSMLVFGERLTPVEWLGIACLGVGLVLISAAAWREGRGSRRGSRAAQPPLIEGS